MPTAVLFNGGVFKSAPIRQRVLDLLASWNQGQPVRELEGIEPDLAVARGAAFYGRTRITGKRYSHQGWRSAIVLRRPGDLHASRAGIQAACEGAVRCSARDAGRLRTPRRRTAVRSSHRAPRRISVLLVDSREAATDRDRSYLMPNVSWRKRACLRSTCLRCLTSLRDRSFLCKSTPS